MTDRSMLDHALAYANRGWAVFPLHTPIDTGCSCRNPQCDSRGKHPRTMAGFKDATTDEAQIRRWWGMWPDANIGLPTGAVSGFVALDVDLGRDGPEHLRELESKHGPLPDTVEVVSGGGGRHCYFRHPGGHVWGHKDLLAPGVEVKGDGGYVVAPPSLHRSGRRYAFDILHDPDDGIALAPMPAWINRPTESRARSAEPVPDGPITEGGRHVSLFRMACAMRRWGVSESVIIDAALAHNRTSCVPPLPEPEVRRLSHNAARYDPSLLSHLSHFDIRESRLGLTGIKATTVRAREGRSWPEAPGNAVYPGLAGRLRDLVDPTSEADPVAVLGTFLTGFSVLIGRRAHFRVGATYHYPRLFSVIAGKSSKARKGESLTPVEAVLKLVDPEWANSRIASGLSSGEGLIYLVRDPVEKPETTKEEKSERREGSPPKLVVVDPGVIDKRLLVVETEFGRLLKVMRRESNIISTIIRDAWDNRPLRVITRTNQLEATGAHIGITVHITLRELEKELGDVELFNGFANRFLWFLARRSKELSRPPVFGGPDVEVLAHELAQTVWFARKVGQVDRDPEANELWDAVYSDLSRERDDLVGTVTGRAEAYVMRLATLYALLDRSEVIRVPHMQSALELWAYCEASAEYIFGESTGDAVADRILTALRRNGPTSRSDLYGALGKHRTKTEIDAALALLQTLGKVECEKQQTDGRPAEIWRAL